MVLMNKTTQRYLNAIAERLWNNQASLFVGAGFSKNAQLETGAKVPPNWDELGDLFFWKSRNRKPRRQDRAYANVLRIAEDVENMCGRPALTDLIRNAINDDLLSPSDTHMQLLALPWQDVYTTNYDTLLDRSAARLKEQNRRFYTIVRDGQEIGMGSSPFLMKVHGDINEPSSIIITEEDYRTYPLRHQAMIAHIHNTIMTRTLVLVGFSGNDPNFIQWLGWVRDALCNNQRKIYLLTVDKLSDAACKTFEKRNVVVVDLRSCGNNRANPSESISAAIKYLEDYPSKRERERVAYRNKALKWGRTPHKEEETEKTLERWKRERESYPGWLVMPREKREYWANTEGFHLSRDKVSQLGDGADLLFLDLFNWRIEKALFPIDNAWESLYLSVLEKYKPFSRRCRADLRGAWLNLKIGLLRLYRQEGWTEKWNRLCGELSLLKGRMNDETRCRFDYEQALAAVYKNDFIFLEEVLCQWKEPQSDPYWDIKRGSLWAEYLAFETGKEITRKAFNKICEKLEKASCEEERFYWASRKVHAHAVWNSMAQANFSDGQEETASARQTWLELRPYEDVWYEREFFESHLRAIEDALRVKTKTASFRLGYSSTSTNLSGNSKDYRVAYAFFLYYEETGFPIHLPYLSSVEKTSLERALSVMSYCSPSIARCWLLRSGDPKMVSAVFNRRFLTRTKRGEVETLYAHFMECFSRLLQEKESGAEPSWALVFRSILPEILSRLCMKASYEVRVKTLDYIDLVIRRKDSVRFEGLDRLMSFLISSFSSQEQLALLPTFARMAIAQDRFGDCRYDPLFYVKQFSAATGTSSEVIEGLLNSLSGSDNGGKAVLLRLLYLDKCSALSKKQQAVLAKKLWSSRDAYGLPAGTVFNRFAFLNFPHPKEVNPRSLIRGYFRNAPFPVVGNGSTVSFYGGHVPVLNDLKGTTNSDISFSWDEPTLNVVCSKLVQMWDSDKARLLEEDKGGGGFSVKEELLSRFSDVESIISTVMASNFNLLGDDNKVRLTRMVDEFESYGVPSFRMRLALPDIGGGNVDLSREVLVRLSSSDDHIIDDCINALIMLYRRGEDVTLGVEWMSDSFRCNSTHGQASIISALIFFVNKTPIVNNAMIREKVLLGLERLYADTVIESVDDELTANNKLNLRLSVAPLVKGLMSLYDGQRPGILLTWCDYYTDEETCWDIKNAFLGD